MSKVKVTVAGVPGTDPVLPRTELRIGKETYYLCFTFRAIAVAQKTLRDAGIDCNLLQSLDLTNMQADRLVPLLYASLITYKPKITLDEVFAMVTFRNLGKVFEAITGAYIASLSDPDEEEGKADPTKAE